MSPQKYRKTSLIEALPFNSIKAWRKNAWPVEWQQAVCECTVNFAEPGGGASPIGHPHIHTLEGTHTVTDGDWIARGIKGEFWPIKADIFAATYEVSE